jgi:hypothetical protein
MRQTTSTPGFAITRTSAPRAALACLLLSMALIAVASGPAAAQRASIDGAINGRVLEEDTGRPIADVWVRVLDAQRRVRGSVQTDDQGRFAFPRLNPGPFAFRVARIGYIETTTPYWQVQGGETLDVTVRMHPTAVLLAPLEINARSRSESPLLAAFYRRMDRGLGGTFFSRQEIERRKPALVTDLLVDVPGIRLEGGSTIGERIVTFDRSLFAAGGGECHVQVFVDGVQAVGHGSGVALNELASPAGLEGVEVYRGLATVPPEFLTPDARCGVIALWTRRGG